MLLLLLLLALLSSQVLCDHNGYDPKCVLGAERPAHFKAPLDASMDTSRLVRAFGLRPRPFKEALSEVFPKEG